MKSHFKSASHQAILQERLKDQEASRLGKITGARAIRVLTNDLTASERLVRREITEQKKRKGPDRSFFAEAKRQIKIEARRILNGHETKMSFRMEAFTNYIGTDRSRLIRLLSGNLNDREKKLLQQISHPHYNGAIDGDFLFRHPEDN